MNEPSFVHEATFQEWLQRAREKRRILLGAADPKFALDERIWQDFKNQILIPFLGRCAYCEGRYSAGEFGDAEHYRPKGAVTENRQPVAHCGYYWLAYEWQNLLLSCKKCNSKHPDRDLKKGSHPGKLCEFPVGGPRVAGPCANPADWLKELEMEQPLLLNPYYDDPEEHFSAVKEGYIWHRTERGKVTIDVCHLNRKELRAERKIAEEQVKSRATHIWVTRASDYRKDCFPSNTAFSTYLNCKLKEELSNQTAEFVKRWQ